MPLINVRFKRRKTEGFIDLPSPSKLGRFKSAPMTASMKSTGLDDLLPEVAIKKEEEEKPANKVFQGKEMREDASWFSKVFFSYARPLLYSSLTQRISFE